MAPKSAKRAAERTKRRTKRRTKNQTKKTSRKPAKKRAKKRATKGTKTAKAAKKPGGTAPRFRATSPTAGLPQVGTRAPAFRLPRDGGGSLALADYAGRKLVLYFYPRADTPGCTTEAIAFSRLKPAFDRAGAGVLGVSADPVAAQDAFKAKYRLAIALCSDATHAMLEAYGVWQEKSMYGRTFMGVARATFLIGPDQRIAAVWPKVAVDGHAEEVLEVAKAL